MNTTTQHNLHAVIATIQKKWGANAIRQGSIQQTQQYISTGFAHLDALIGGIPHGQTTELLGRPTSGMTTLAYRIMAAAQQQGQYAIYVDLDSTFSPDYAVGCGIDLRRLFLARPETEVQALDIVRDLLQEGHVSVIVLDLGQTLPHLHRLRRLAGVLARSGCVVVLLVALVDGAKPQGVLNGTPAAIRLYIERKEWLTRYQDIRGYQTCITVLGRHPSSGQQVLIDIDFDNGFEGEIP
ncbi:MAG: DNA recombination/repair protein RecA [Chloroflexi bacterium]|nr:DNA recombination/repair protein RecA [Chloroflexota bacterium]